MGKYLPLKIKSIYIILGNGCNLRCRYCLQQPPAVGPLINETDLFGEVYKFTKGLALDNPKLRIVFYGGEPLLYFSEIQKLVAACGELNYSVITNGRALTDEMVSFFNKHCFGVAISWDGGASERTRGFDFFQQQELRERALRLEKLCLTGVISAAAYPSGLLRDFAKIAKLYQKNHGRPCDINLDEIMDTGIADRSLLAVDYERVRKEMRLLASFYVHCLADGRSGGVYAAYIGSIIRAAKRYYDATGWRSRTARCGNGLTTLNVDLQGYLYPCHNVRSAAGTIRSDFFKYLGKILETDDTGMYRHSCLGCSALPVCGGGCKLVTAQARANGYCELKRAVYGTVLEALKDMGDSIMALKKEE